MISVGSSIPAAPGSLWVEKDNNTVSFPSSGKYIIVGVPGAFTRSFSPCVPIKFLRVGEVLTKRFSMRLAPCSSQVPGYVENYDKLKEKGISAVYIVAVNDIVSSLYSLPPSVI